MRRQNGYEMSFDHVVASPLVRARQTAEIIASAAGKPLDVDDGIIECDFGSLEGTRSRRR